MNKTWRDYAFVGLQALLFVAFFLPVTLPVEFPFRSPDLFISAVILLGLLELGLAFLQLKTNLTPWPTPKPNGYLVTTGVFSFVRHPIYSGIFLIFTGLALKDLSAYKMLITGILLLLFFLKSVYEEKQLLKQFPQYASYRKRVGRFAPKIFRPGKKKK